MAFVKKCTASNSGFTIFVSQRIRHELKRLLDSTNKSSDEPARENESLAVYFCGGRDGEKPEARGQCTSTTSRQERSTLGGAQRSSQASGVQDSEIPYLRAFAVKRPAVPTADFCGRVVGSSDELVFGMVKLPGQHGVLSQYAPAPRSTFLPLPRSLTPEQGADTYVAAFTAYVSISSYVKQGETGSS